MLIVLMVYRAKKHQYNERSVSVSMGPPMETFSICPQTATGWPASQTVLSIPYKGDIIASSQPQ